MGFLSELYGKKKEGPSESYYENGDVPREFFSIGTTDTHYLVKEGIPCASVLSPEPGGRGRPRRQRLQRQPPWPSCATGISCRRFKRSGGPLHLETATAIPT